MITAPLCKGSSAEGGEGLFFYNPSTTSWSPSPYTGEALIQPSPVGEGGSRRLTDEVYFCKRNFNNCIAQIL